jgi:hypothetical protein
MTIVQLGIKILHIRLYIFNLICILLMMLQGLSIWKKTANINVPSYLLSETQHISTYMYG